MAAMLVVVCLLSVMMTMKSDGLDSCTEHLSNQDLWDARQEATAPVSLRGAHILLAASTQNITAHSGEEVLLTSDLQEVELNNVRWTHPNLVIYPKNNRTTCPHGHCELLSNGSLRFSRVHINDSGCYRLEVFNQEGKILKTKKLLLMVDNVSSSSHSSSPSSSSSVLVPVLMCCFLLLLFFIITFILMRRLRLQRMVTGLRHDNVYMSMHGHRGNKSEEEEKQQTEEHDSHYVPCKPVVSMETPITQQMEEDAEDIYV